MTITIVENPFSTSTNALGISGDGMSLLALYETEIKFFLSSVDMWIQTDSLDVGGLDLAVSSDCRTLCVKQAEKVKLYHKTDTWDLVFEVSKSLVRSIAVSSDGSVLAVGSAFGVDVYSTDDGQLLCATIPHDCFDLSLSADGTVVAVGDRCSGMLYVYTVHAGGYTPLGEELCFCSNDTHADFLNIRVVLSADGSQALYSCKENANSRLRVQRLVGEGWVLVHEEVFPEESNLYLATDRTGEMVCTWGGSQKQLSFAQLGDEVTSVFPTTDGNKSLLVSGDGLKIVVDDTTYHLRTASVDYPTLRSTASVFFGADFPSGDFEFTAALTERINAVFDTAWAKHKDRSTQAIIQSLTQIGIWLQKLTPELLGEFMTSHYPELLTILNTELPVDAVVVKHLTRFDLHWPDQDLQDWSYQNNDVLRQLVADFLGLDSTVGVSVVNLTQGSVGVVVEVTQTDTPVHPDIALLVTSIEQNSDLGNPDAVEMNVTQLISTGEPAQQEVQITLRLTGMENNNFHEVSGVDEDAVVDSAFSTDGTVLVCCSPTEVRVYRKQLTQWVLATEFAVAHLTRVVVSRRGQFVATQDEETNTVQTFQVAAGGDYQLYHEYVQPGDHSGGSLTFAAPFDESHLFTLYIGGQEGQLYVYEDKELVSTLVSPGDHGVFGYETCAVAHLVLVSSRGTPQEPGKTFLYHRTDVGVFETIRDFSNDGTGSISVTADALHVAIGDRTKERVTVYQEINNGVWSSSTIYLPRDTLDDSGYALDLIHQNNSLYLVAGNPNHNTGAGEISILVKTGTGWKRVFRLEGEAGQKIGHGVQVSPDGYIAFFRNQSLSMYLLASYTPWPLGQGWRDPGVTVTPAWLQPSLVAEGEVDTSTDGTYTLRYSVGTKSIHRQVQVDSRYPTISEPTSYFLTPLGDPAELTNTVSSPGSLSVTKIHPEWAQDTRGEYQVTFAAARSNTTTTMTFTVNITDPPVLQLISPPEVYLEVGTEGREYLQSLVGRAEDRQGVVLAVRVHPEAVDTEVPTTEPLEVVFTVEDPATQVEVSASVKIRVVNSPVLELTSTKVFWELNSSGPDDLGVYIETASGYGATSLLGEVQIQGTVPTTQTGLTDLTYTLRDPVTGLRAEATLQVVVAEPPTPPDLTRGTGLFVPKDSTPPDLRSFLRTPAVELQNNATEWLGVSSDGEYIMCGNSALQNMYRKYDIWAVHEDSDTLVTGPAVFTDDNNEFFVHSGNSLYHYRISEENITLVESSVPTPEPIQSVVVSANMVAVSYNTKILFITGYSTTKEFDTHHTQFDFTPELLVTYAEVGEKIHVTSDFLTRRQSSETLSNPLNGSLKRITVSPDNSCFVIVDVQNQCMLYEKDLDNGFVGNQGLEYRDVLFFTNQDQVFMAVAEITKNGVTVYQKFQDRWEIDIRIFRDLNVNRIGVSGDGETMVVSTDHSGVRVIRLVLNNSGNLTPGDIQISPETLDTSIVGVTSVEYKFLDPGTQIASRSYLPFTITSLPEITFDSTKVRSEGDQFVVFVAQFSDQPPLRSYLEAVLGYDGNEITTVTVEPETISTEQEGTIGIHYSVTDPITEFTNLEILNINITAPPDLELTLSELVLPFGATTEPDWNSFVSGTPLNLDIDASAFNTEDANYQVTFVATDSLTGLSTTRALSVVFVAPPDLELTLSELVLPFGATTEPDWNSFVSGTPLNLDIDASAFNTEDANYQVTFVATDSLTGLSTTRALSVVFVAPPDLELTLSELVLPFGATTEPDWNSFVSGTPLNLDIDASAFNTEDENYQVTFVATDSLTGLSTTRALSVVFVAPPVRILYPEAYLLENTTTSIMEFFDNISGAEFNITLVDVDTDIAILNGSYLVLLKEGTTTMILTVGRIGGVITTEFSINLIVEAALRFNPPPSFQLGDTVNLLEFIPNNYVGLRVVDINPSDWTHTPGSQTVVFVVEDTLGSPHSKEFTILVEDNSFPEVNLIGTNQVWLVVGAVFEDPGVTFSPPGADFRIEIFNNEDNEIQDSANTDAPGDYSIVYTVVGSNGNASEVYRELSVRYPPPAVDLGVVWVAYGTDPGAVWGRIDDLFTESPALSWERQTPTVVDTHTEGPQTIGYVLTDPITTFTTEQTVTVVVTQAPVIAQEVKYVMHNNTQYTNLLTTMFSSTDEVEIVSCSPVWDVSETQTYLVVVRASNTSNKLATTDSFEVTVADPPTLTPTVPASITLVEGVPREVESFVTSPGESTVIEMESTPVDDNEDVDFEYTFWARDEQTGFVSSEVTVAVVIQPVPEIKLPTGFERGQVVDLTEFIQSDHSGLDVHVKVDGEEQIQPTAFTSTGTHYVTFSIADSLGYRVTREFTVVITDTTGPTAELNGLSAVWVLKGGRYEEVGVHILSGDPATTVVTETRVLDPDGSLVVTDAVDTFREGEYTLTYLLTDGSGNQVELTRTVYVGTVPFVGNVAVPTGATEALLRETVDGAVTAALGDNEITWARQTSAFDSSTAGILSVKYDLSSLSQDWSTVLVVFVHVVDPPVLVVTEAVVGVERGTLVNLTAYLTNREPAVEVSVAGELLTQPELHRFVTPGLNTVDYLKTDVHGFTASAQLEVNVRDTTPPVLGLLGPKVMVVVSGVDFQDPGVFVEPEAGGVPEESNDHITVTVQVNGQVLGEGNITALPDIQLEATTVAYRVEYTCRDSSGNTSNSVFRTVLVGYVAEDWSSVGLGPGDLTGPITMEGIILPCDLSQWTNMNTVKTTWSQLFDETTQQSFLELMIEKIASVFQTEIGSIDPAKVKAWVDAPGAFSRKVFTVTQVESIKSQLTSSVLKLGNLIGVNVSLQFEGTTEETFTLYLRHIQ